MRIVSGGQTGVDRAALDFALARQVDHGGWCPKGRIAYDGVLPGRYHLQETPSAGYRQRTLWNVRDSDATLILNEGPLTTGTLMTLRFAEQLGRPHLLVQMDASAADEQASQIRHWLAQLQPGTLNVAGPRETKSPGIYGRTLALLAMVGIAG